MAFFMRSLPGRPVDSQRAGTTPAGRRRWRLLDGWLGALLALLLALSAGASAQSTTDVRVVHEPEGLYLSARLPLDVPAGLEDVLLRGVPMHFIWQADVRRARWYWTDQRLATAYRVVRVVYQPLTRRWRVSVGTGLPTDRGLAGALHQNLDSFEQAMAAVLSVSRWHLMPGGAVPDAAGLRVELQFRMDGGLLPRPFRLGDANTVDWGMTHRQTLPVLPAEPVKEPS